LVTLAVTAISATGSRSAHADESVVDPPPIETGRPWSGARFQLEVGVGIGQYHRTNRPTYVVGGNPPTYDVARGSEGGGALGLEAHLHPNRMHGAFLGWNLGGGVFGPTVNIVHAGYSLRIGAPLELHGVTFDGLVDVGPAIGYVERASEQPDHVAIGGHLGVSAQIYFGSFVLGARASYDAGYSMAPGGGLDGALLFSLDLGFAVHPRDGDQ
jgi:hypothetical protein